MSGRKIGRILADLEDEVIEQGLPAEQAEKLVDAIERKVDKWLDEAIDEGEVDESDDSDDKSG